MTPWATIALVVCIGGASALQLFAGGADRSVDLAGLVKPSTRAGEWWRLLTAAYVHGSFKHLVANLGVLGMLGAAIEGHNQRLRLPLVYLLSALAGSAASLMTSDNPAFGASCGILGLAGYLLVVSFRSPVPAGVRRLVLFVLGATAVVGIVGLIPVDNPAHAAGALTGMVIGLVTAIGSASRHRRLMTQVLDGAGWCAAGVVIVGALYTAARLFQIAS